VTRVLDASGDPPDEVAVSAAVEALREGDIIAVPTDTVYGLAADPWHSGASDRLFRVKRRPRNVELVLFVTGVDQALELSESVPASALRLMRELWPGGLTIVLPRRPGIEADLGEDDATIGLRCPAHPVPLAIAAQFGPFATTSANLHGQPPAVVASELSDLPGVALVLDGGTCDESPSAVVDATGEMPRLIRPGSVPWDRVLTVALGNYS
jgi:L-threonylcarbamoyladenylate synthase